ncbi:type II secretion system GspH family protein [Sulfurimonas sp.]|nr:type II secretion system GspH family protein [Sulfurimonas sp.]
MVRSNNPSQRLAFTMIELIFAIVIIAISVMSLPMMTQVTNKGLEESLVQEAIFVGSAELMGATTAYWDANSLQDINVSSLSRVINIANDCDDTTKLRPGHIAQPYHRQCLDDNTTGAADAGADSLDDMEKTDEAVFLNANPTAEGYKKSYTTSIDVNRTGNIKTITVTIKDAGASVTVLKTQSANIGEIDYYKRSF